MLWVYLVFQVLGLLLTVLIAALWSMFDWTIPVFTTVMFAIGWRITTGSFFRLKSLLFLGTGVTILFTSFWLTVIGISVINEVDRLGLVSILELGMSILSLVIGILGGFLFGEIDTYLKRRLHHTTEYC